MRTRKNVDRVRAFSRQIDVWMIADELNECTVHQIVTQDLNMEKSVHKDGSK
jgi:hypothetical protein